MLSCVCLLCPVTVLSVDTTARGEIVVDDSSLTTQPDVYAVGDIITGAIQLTPVCTRGATNPQTSHALCSLLLACHMPALL